MNSASRWLFLVWCCTTRELQFEFLICIFSFPSTFLQALPSNLQGFISLRYFAHSFAFHLMVYGSLITLRQKVPINIQCTLEQLPIKVSPHLFFLKKKTIIAFSVDSELVTYLWKSWYILGEIIEKMWLTCMCPMWSSSLLTLEKVGPCYELSFQLIL